MALRPTLQRRLHPFRRERQDTQPRAGGVEHRGGERRRDRAARSKSFIYPRLAPDFIERMLRITCGTAKNKDEVAQIASRITKQPADRFGWLFTKDDTYRDANMVPNLDALQRNIDATRELGLIKKKNDVKHTPTPAWCRRRRSGSNN